MLFAFSMMNGSEITVASAKNPAAAAAPVRQLPVNPSTTRPTNWSTRAAPTPPSTHRAAVDTIR